MDFTAHSAPTHCFIGHSSWTDDGSAGYPQSLGYATLAGLPPIMGLYAAITPVIVYAWIGASSVSSIGPVAITAIMTASALSGYATGSLQYISLAIVLAFMVGGILLIAGLIRLGWIMQFVSRGVASGFISGAAVLIIFSQLKHIIGIPLNTDSLINLFFKYLYQHSAHPFADSVTWDWCHLVIYYQPLW